MKTRTRAPMFLPVVAGLFALPAEAPAGLAECREIEDDTRRLACFDRLAAQQDADASVEDVAEGGEAPPAPAALVAASPREPASTAGGGAARTDDEPAGLVARVATFTRLNRSNRIRVTLDNGQVWQEIDAKRFRGNVEPGTEVTISPRPFGGYRLDVPGYAAGILVRRIR